VRGEVEGNGRFIPPHPAAPLPRPDCLSRVFRRCRPVERGQHAAGVAAAEFALTLPLLPCLFWPPADFCRGLLLRADAEACANDAVLFSSGTAKPPSGTTARRPR